MGPKKVRRSLYAGKGVPKAASDAQVLEVLFGLFEDLQKKLKTEYRWMASCTVAVEAGRHGGLRRVKARIKLLGLINECRGHLSLPLIDPPKDWAQANLYFGYGAVGAYAQAQGSNIERVLFEQFLRSRGADLDPQR